MSSTEGGAPLHDPEPSSARSSTIIDKAFLILEVFNGDERVLTLSEITKASGLPKSTVHRVIARLVAHGAVERHGDRYKLGIGLVQLGATSLAGLLRDVSLPYLSELRRWTGQRVELTVLRQADAVCLERIDDTPRAIRDVGLKQPAHQSPAGRAILAFSDLDAPQEIAAAVLADDLHPATAGDRFRSALRDIRVSGVAHGQNWPMQGMTTLSAPIVPLSRANAAVSLIFASGAQPPSTAEHALKEATARIATDLRAHLTGEQRGRWFPPTD